MLVGRVQITACALALSFGTATFSDEPPTKKASEPTKGEKPISQLIDDLGSKRFATRQEAAKQLKARAKEGIPELLRAADQSPDSEIKEEAKKLADQILWPKDEATAKKQLVRLPELIKNQQVDLIIELLVYWREYVTWEETKLVVEFLKTVTEQVSAIANKQVKQPNFLYSQLVKVGEADDIDGGKAVIAERLKLERSPTSNLILASKLQMHDARFSDSRILCNATTMPTDAGWSLVLVNGDLILQRENDPEKSLPISNSIIICRGSVKSRHIRDSIVIAGGSINTGRISPFESVIIEKEDKLTRRFFGADRNHLGISFEDAKRLLVRDVDQSILGKNSEIKKGDVLRTLNQVPIESLEDLRRIILRTQVAGAHVFCFGIERDGKRLFVTAHPN